MSPIERFIRRIQALPKQPRLRPGYELIEITAGRYLFHSGLRSFEVHLPAPGFPLAAFFDQLASCSELAVLLEPFPPFQIAFLLDLLEALQRAGLLIAQPGSGGNGASPKINGYALWLDHLRQGNPATATQPPLEASEWHERLRQARVGVVGLGRVGSQLARLLAIAGVGHLAGLDGEVVDEELTTGDAWYEPGQQGLGRPFALARQLESLNRGVCFTPLAHSLEPSEDATLPERLLDQDLLVVACDQPRPALYEWINRRCLEARLPWTSYRMSWMGLAAEIGPTVIPYETACYTCYQLRRRSNLAHPDQDEAVAHALDTRPLPLFHLPVTPALSLLCYEILCFLSGQVVPLTCNTILEFDLGRAELHKRPLLKIPRCPACRREVGEFTPTRFWADLYAEASLPVAPLAPATPEGMPS